MNRSLKVVLAVTIFAVGCGRAGQGPESPSPVSLIASGGSAAAGLIVIAIGEPVTLVLTVSVAVRDWMPAVVSVALKEWTPWSAAVKV